MKTSLILLLVCNTCYSQKWYKITKNDVAIMSLQAVSGFGDGWNQAIMHHKYGEDIPFFNYKLSFTRKYKHWPDDRREAFPGSKTVLVFATDGYHMTRAITNIPMYISIGVSYGEIKSYPKKDRWKVIAKKAILSALTNRVVFSITYKYI